MLPVGPLMIEHRLIERMVEVMRKELDRMERAGDADPQLIEKAVDFIRTYADRCHHGKEEDILFRELGKKSLSAEHAGIMKELKEEHRLGRKITTQLAQAGEGYLKGKKETFTSIADSMKRLVELYPSHIEKEDKHFFLPVMEYFSDEEIKSMLEEERDFDRQLIHLKYREMVKALE